MEIGIYSGSFDPIHTGHAMVASYCAQWGGIDEVWLMVSRQNPLKEGRPPAPGHHRLQMVELVADLCVNVKASGFELEMPPGPSYTYDTLCLLRERYPAHRFRLIIGSDNWVDFGRWRNAHKIISEFGLLVYPRPGFAIPRDLREGVRVIPGGPTAHVSSSFVRHALAEGRDINFFVPVPVARYIRTHGLYLPDDGSGTNG